MSWKQSRRPLEKRTNSNPALLSAYHAGQRARRNRLPIEACPYRDLGPERKKRGFRRAFRTAWERGWTDAG